MKAIKDFFKEIINKDFLISIFCLMGLQAIVYIFIKYLQFDYHSGLSTIDSIIPFVPHFIYIYNIFYPFVFIVLYYVFCNDKEKYYQGILAGVIGYLLSDIIFLVYPTIMIRPYVIYDKLDFLTGLIIKITYSIDNPPLNCFPSVHCLFCFQVIYTTVISRNIARNKKIIITLVSLLIALSTVLVKQHYFYDIFGAFIVFVLSNILVYIIKKIVIEQ